jgi:dipeptidyl aminopeptidase/acylaminoacyl peptidase
MRQFVFWTGMILTLGLALAGRATAADRLTLRDVFDLELASDPQISPDGRRVVYVRTSMDVMKDQPRGNLWIIDSDGGNHRALGAGSQSSPRWSPDGTRLLSVAAAADGASEIRLRWMDSGQEARLARVTEGPRGLAWSPDGRWIAFAMLVPEIKKPPIEMPDMPEGADWGPPIRYIDRLFYRADGKGYLKTGYVHLFVLPADGGTPRPLTTGAFHDGEPVWSPDGHSLLFSANRHEDWEYDPENTEIYEVSAEGGDVRALTDRKGPDDQPAISPDGRLLASTGFDDRYQGYQVRQLYVTDRTGANRRSLTAGFDRDAGDPAWSRDGRGIFFKYDERGNGKIGYVPVEGGPVRTLAGDVGHSLDRPYAGGSFTVAADGRFAYTVSLPDRPSDVAVGRLGPPGKPAVPGKLLTALNEDVFTGKRLGRVEEIAFASSFDGRAIQGWIVKPPDFDPGKKYPLVLEIHGGPFADYGNRFGADMQLYAAAGYVVLYTNPRGSTSYGEEFGNLIHHAYPGHDYEDLMSGVDAVIAKGYVDAANLFVTGGSGGGVLTSWIIGKTDRFRAAVVQKPVINWMSFVLTADEAAVFTKYWFEKLPWENPKEYLDRSPLSLVGNVKTPTLLITGEVDYRTPISETEQFYQALKLRKVEAAMVRIPDASHGIDARPSNLIAKIAHVLAWFAKHRTDI